MVLIRSVRPGPTETELQLSLSFAFLTGDSGSSRKVPNIKKDPFANCNHTHATGHIIEFRDETGSTGT